MHKTYFLTLDNKVTILCVGFYYSTCDKDGKDMVLITFENKDQYDRQIKLLTEHGIEFTTIPTENYPKIFIVADRFIPYKVNCGQDFEVHLSNTTLRRNAVVWIDGVDNNGDKIILHNLNGFHRCVKRGLMDSRFEVVDATKNVLTINFGDIINIKI